MYSTSNFVGFDTRFGCGAGTASARQRASSAGAITGRCRPACIIPDRFVYPDHCPGGEDCFYDDCGNAKCWSDKLLRAKLAHAEAQEQIKQIQEENRCLLVRTNDARIQACAPLIESRRVFGRLPDSQDAYGPMDGLQSIHSPLQMLGGTSLGSNCPGAQMAMLQQQMECQHQMKLQAMDKDLREHQVMMGIKRDLELKEKRNTAAHQMRQEQSRLQVEMERARQMAAINKEQDSAQRLLTQSLEQNTKLREQLRTLTGVEPICEPSRPTTANSASFIASEQTNQDLAQIGASLEHIKPLAQWSKEHIK